MSKIIIFDVSNVKINDFWHLEKFNVVNIYIWWVTNVKKIIFYIRWEVMEEEREEIFQRKKNAHSFCKVGR